VRALKPMNNLYLRAVLPLVSAPLLLSLPLYADAPGAGTAPISQTTEAGNVDLAHWPKGCSPLEVGRRVANRFVATPHPNFGSPRPPRHITYPEVCAWYGALTFAKESRDPVLVTQLEHRFEPLFGPEVSMVPPSNHVDNSVFGSVPLELYRQTGEARYLEMGQRIADQQWEPPKPENVKGQEYFSKGLTKYTRLWIDDMYMVFYLDNLQKPNGLFFHAPDVPFYWGRGNGWMAAGMTELLRSLPDNDPNRPRIMRGYRQMMDSLLKFQAPSGMWRQLVDDPESWPETSCTGMFTFAMITGVKNGWLEPATFAPAARRGWLALISYLDENGEVSQVCEGTNKTNNRQFYLDRKRLKGDMHGQAPILWSATALLR
jgi:unsaturated rhamnogalacturonyl hydrolase